MNDNTRRAAAYYNAYEDIKWEIGTFTCFKGEYTYADYAEESLRKIKRILERVGI